MQKVNQCPLKKSAELILIVAAIVMFVVLVEIFVLKSTLKCPDTAEENYLVAHSAIDNETAEMINRLFEEKGVGVRIMTNKEEFIQKLSDYIDKRNLSKIQNISRS